MDNDFLAKYYKLERKHWWFKIREKILHNELHKKLPQNRPLKILNVGAASGRTTEMLTNFGRVTSVEIDKTLCEFLRRDLGIEVIEATVTSLPLPDEYFDVICAFDVLEHVENDIKAIMEMKRVCKSGGQIYVTVPAFSFLWSNHDVVNHHYRRYTAKRLRQLVGNGFEVRYETYFNAMLFLPIACYRLIQRWVPRKKIQSDFIQDGMLSQKWLNLFFEKLFGVEVFLLRHIKLPFGVSILATGKKN